MALPSGTIVVTDRQAFGGAGGLIAVDPGSGQQTALSQGGMFVDPSGVAIAGDGTIIVSDQHAFGGTGGLIAVDPGSGAQTKVVAATFFIQPFGIAVDGDGSVLVAYLRRAEHPRGDVMRVDPDNGEHRAVAPGFAFRMPAWVTLDGGGNIWVADDDIAGFDSRLIRVDRTSGTATVVAVDRPPGAIYQGAAVDQGGRILVANDPNHGTKELHRFDPVSGGSTTVSAGQKFVRPMGVALEASGTILVADFVSGVLRVDPNGGAQTTVSAGDKLVDPCGVAVAR